MVIAFMMAEAFSALPGKGSCLRQAPTISLLNYLQRSQLVLFCSID